MNVLCNIALAANTSWYLYNFRKNTILSLKRCGYNLFVIAPRDNYTPKLIALGVNYIDIKIDSSGLNPFVDLATCFFFYRAFKKHRIDLVLNFTPKVNIYSSLACYFADKVKVINNIAGLGTVFTADSFLSRIVKLLYKISCYKVDFIFFQNEEDRGLFISNNLISKSKTFRLPGSGVDLNRFKVSKVERSEHLSFLLACRMLRKKGVLEFMEAARVLKEKYGEKMEFNMLGFLDDENPNYVKMSEIQPWIDHGVVKYLGVTDKIEELISQHDCVVLPSYYREGVPKFLLEAAAMGKPIITTDNVGCRDIVDDGVNGFLCQPKNKQDLINKIENLFLLSDTDYTKFCLASRKKVEREFDEKIVIFKYIEQINILLNNSLTDSETYH
ncbi:glycosyltransferase family 4 protein [Escherichia coli]|uniref:glycosyltransferase family 4 protein n=1 Tax=Escherichia coli TaxID=562 RepID=UPI0010814D16|nr:glycosyltransferase family 4 protein [Escherichia coli]TGJ40319.1 glycosyltransferase family 1 protein [Escherichia coli]TGJ45146.1 glycosyltransferase family 1 protein [Escherichia coli]